MLESVELGTLVEQMRFMIIIYVYNCKLEVVTGKRRILKFGSVRT